MARVYAQNVCLNCGRTISESAYSGRTGNYKKHVNSCDGTKINPKDPDDQLLILAVEFGYRGGEKGWNLERTLEEFKKTLD